MQSSVTDEDQQSTTQHQPGVGSLPGAAPAQVKCMLLLLLLLLLPLPLLP
jgi:hypothetical protein